ncbi:MAG: ADP-forming succinate--CoA ligase subunit beta [Spirochaetaceae bacterium]
MKLLEYKAHEIFRTYGVAGIDGYTASTPEELADVDGKLPYPVVIKAQVQTGNRGKLGGIKFATDKAELLAKGTAILGMTIKDLEVKRVFITPKVEIEKEMYLSFTMDRKTKLGVMIFSPEGGVDINEIVEKNPDKVAKVLIPAGETIPEFMLQYVVDKTGLDKALQEEFKEICRKLYKAYVKHDCLLAEINPLVVTADGHLRALDGKVDIDDNALYRHPEIAEFRDEITENPLILDARKFDFLYIPIKDAGSIAVVSNGSGMIMSSIDLISKRGMEVTCALDLGGGATADRITEALRIVAENTRVDTIFINIFGGITRCDEIATGVKQAFATINAKRLVIRLEGTNKEQGLDILRGIEGDIELVDGLYEGVDALAEGEGATA